jgi:hypothetical protein
VQAVINTRPSTKLTAFTDWFNMAQVLLTEQFN